MNTDLQKVYYSYYPILSDEQKVTIKDNESVFKNIALRIWNVIKFIFDQSDWQIASKKLASVILTDGNKDSDNFSQVIFPGLREDIFSYSEAREIADNVLNRIIKVKKSPKTFSQAILSAREHIDQCAGEVFFRKASKNPEMFPQLNLKSENFLHANRKKQLEIICNSVIDGAAGFKELTSLLYDVAHPPLI